MFTRASNTLPWVSLVLAAACWGLGAVLSKAALAHLPPLTLLVTQLLASLAVLWPVLRLQRIAVPWSKRLLALSLLGWLNPGISYVLSLIGLSLTSASASALLWALEPLLIAALAWLLLREQLTPRFVALGGVAAAGAILVIGTTFGQRGALLGSVLILAGVACCAVYTVLARRTGAEFNPLVAVTVQESLALGWAVLIWPIELNRTLLAGLRQVPLESWGLAALSGVVYYGLAFWFYLAALRQVPASEAGMFINLVPLFAIGGALLILGEKLAPLQWLGAALVLAAVAGASRHQPPQPKQAET